MAALIAVNQFAVTLYLPATPAISRGLSAHPAVVQMSLAVFLFSMGTSQLIYGPLSDYYGRRRVLFVGLILLVMSSLAVMLSQDITQLILARFLQGLGAGAGPVISRAILRDHFQGKHLGSAISLLMMAASVTAAISPFLGGHLQMWFGWRACFAFMALYAVSILGAYYVYLPETNVRIGKVAFSLRNTLHDYADLLKSRIVFSYLLCIILSFAGIIIYQSVAPFILQDQLGLTAGAYGTIIIIPSVMTFMAGFISSRLSAHMRRDHLMLLGTVFMLAGGGALVLGYYLGFFNVTTVVLGICLAIFGRAFVFANAGASLLQPYPDMAGTVGALTGFFQMAGSALISALLNILNWRSMPTLGVTYLALATMIIVITFFVITSKRRKEGQVVTV